MFSDLTADEVPVSRVILDRMKVAAAHTLPTGLQGIDVKVVGGMVADQLMAHISGFVLGEHLANDTETATEVVPASWWDHAKDDLQAWAESSAHAYRPAAWLLRHLKPAKHREVVLSVTWHRYATRPMSTIRMPDNMGPVVYQERVDRSVRWRDV